MANIVASVSGIGILGCVAIFIIVIGMIAIVHIVIHSNANISFRADGLFSIDVKQHDETHRQEIEYLQSDRIE